MKTRGQVLAILLLYCKVPLTSRDCWKGQENTKFIYKKFLGVIIHSFALRETVYYFLFDKQAKDLGNRLKKNHISWEKTIFLLAIVLLYGGLD